MGKPRAFKTNQVIRVASKPTRGSYRFPFAGSAANFPLDVLVEALEQRVMLTIPVSGAVPAMSSHPAATASLYLDFDGDRSTLWGIQYLPGTTPAFDIDNDPQTFSDSELNLIEEIYKRVSEKFSPFNLNVTTVDPGTYAEGKAYRVVIGGDGSWYYSNPTALGTAQPNGFLSGFDNNTAWVFSKKFSSAPWNQLHFSANVANDIAHETGHGFGLEHYDPNARDEEGNYINIAAGRYPLMLNGVSQEERRIWWSGTAIDGNGSPLGAQDDLEHIGTYLASVIGYRDDDHIVSSPKWLNGAGTPEDPWSGDGIIERLTDNDAFTFTVDRSGTVSLDVNVFELGPMLDAKIRLQRDDGSAVIPPVDSANRLSESIKDQPITAGTYRLIVSSHGSPGDVGQYTVKGVFKGDTPPPPVSTDPTIVTASLRPALVAVGGTFFIDYRVSSPAGRSVLLGAAIRPNGEVGWIPDPDRDVAVMLVGGQGTYSRNFSVSPTQPQGSYDLRVDLWTDANSDGRIDASGGDELIPGSRRELLGVLTVNSVGTPPPAGLVSRWRADGDASDERGANPGTLQSGAIFAPGKFGQAFAFDRPSGFVSIPDSPSLRPDTFTVGGWFNLTQTPGEILGSQEFVLASKYASNYDGWIIRIGSSLKPAFSVHRQPGLGVDVQTMSSVAIPLNTWVHIAATYDGTTANLYVDGTLRGSATFSGGYTPSPGPMTIGKASWYSGGYMGGLADDVVFYNRVLSGPEIEGLAQGITKRWTGAVSNDWFNPANWNPSGVPVLTDDLSVDGGTVTIDTSVYSAFFGKLFLNAGTLNWPSGSFAGHVYVAAGAVVNITGSVDKTMGLFTNRGTINWSGSGTPNAGGGLAVENLVGGFFDIQGDVRMRAGWNPQPVFINAGTFRKSGGTGVSVFENVPFTNTGTVEILSGTLMVGMTYTQTVGATVLNGGILASGSPLNIQGGVLNGSATVGAGVSNSGIVRPGLPSGVLTVNGNYAQSSTGRLEIQYGASSAGLQADPLTLDHILTVTPGPGAQAGGLAVNGTVSLGGSLDLSFGPIPFAGQTFLILNNDGFDPITGTFAGLLEGATASAAGGGQFRISYVGGDGNDVTLTSLPPAVAAAWVAGSAWQPAYRSALQSAGVGSADGGFALSPAAPTAVTLPWLNLNQVTVRFSRAVNVAAGSLHVQGSAVQAYALAPAGGFAYDPATFTATWTLAAPLPLDRVRLSLTGVADLAGNPLADFSLPFNVVPGDADRNNRVDAFDTLGARARQGSNLTTNTANYSPWFDVDGNGRIDAFDTLGIRAKQGTNLNTVPVPAAALFGARAIEASSDDDLVRLLEREQVLQ